MSMYTELLEVEQTIHPPHRKLAPTDEFFLVLTRLSLGLQECTPLTSLPYTHSCSLSLSHAHTHTLSLSSQHHQEYNRLLLRYYISCDSVTYTLVYYAGKVMIQFCV